MVSEPPILLSVPNCLPRSEVSSLIVSCPLPNWSSHFQAADSSVGQAPQQLTADAQGLLLRDLLDVVRGQAVEQRGPRLLHRRGGQVDVR